MTETSLLVAKDERGVATVTLNRPDVRNAFNTELISAIETTITELDTDPTVRVIILTGAGKAFSAGADLNMMSEVAKFSDAENVAEGTRLASMLFTLYQCPKPIIAKVNGPAMGGGLGLIATSDIAVGVDTAFFAFSEARLGITPATISPFVLKAIGPQAASRYFLTGERFSAETGEAMGLLHEVTSYEFLDEAVETIVESLLASGPNAQAEAKALIRDFAGKPITQAIMTDAAHRIAKVRASDEGQEGLSAFLEKRAPNWVDR